ncbi:cation diffusion facilitator family transporter [Leptospira sp. 96542]|nr:cation diffusion facilitator family transporter [Leptospira sp. 96542]
MGHNHDHSHSGHETKNLVLAFFLNFGFAVFELIGGLYSNSVAIVSDAIHDFGDSLSLALVWYLQKYSDRPSDVKFSFGYKRFSLLGAIIISGILLIGSFFMIMESIKRIISPEETNSIIMFYLAIVGVIINLFALFRLKHGKSFTDKAVYLHFLEDALGWVAVLIGSILMISFNISWIDPMISIGIAFWILWNVYKNLKQVIRILMQAVPNDFELDHFISDLKSIPFVLDVHEIRVWSLDGTQHVMTMHIVTDAKLQDHKKVRDEIKTLAHNFGVEHLTIEMEQLGESCGLVRT